MSFYIKQGKGVLHVSLLRIMITSRPLIFTEHVFNTPLLNVCLQAMSWISQCMSVVRQD